MTRIHRYDLLPDDDSLEPLDRRPTVVLEDQRSNMRRLREKTNAIAGSYLERDGLIHAFVVSNALSRSDIARATGLNVSRVHQIAREQAERQQGVRNDEAAARLEAHTTPATRERWARAEQAAAAVRAS